MASFAGRHDASQRDKPPPAATPNATPASVTMRVPSKVLHSAGVTQHMLATCISNQGFQALGFCS